MYSQKVFSFAIALTMLLTISLFLGCGGGGASTPAQQGPQAVSITISPANASSVVNQPTQFTAQVTNTSNTGVTWSIKEAQGGAIANGLYTAPWTTGTYHIVATSQADSTKSASAVIAVRAPFAFIQEVLNGTATPFSMTPKLGTFGPDGKFITTGLTESATGKPVEVPITSIFLSHDAAKAVFTVSELINESSFVNNIYTANIDGTELKKILSAGESEYYGDPQFTPDDAEIVYVKSGEIWMMNADGSNQHVIYSGLTGSTDYVDYVYQIAVSPNGDKIAASLDRYISGAVGSAIGIMNSDGTDLLLLTGNAQGTGCWDEFPTFNNDGKQIVFGHFCQTQGEPYQVWESIFTMNLDGSSMKAIYGDGTNGTIHTDPLAVGDKVVFASNMDNPNSTQMDLYSIQPDGKGLVRLTNNQLFDGFNDYYFNNYSTGTLQSPFSKRLQQSQRWSFEGQARPAR